jgi:hypothetical protein
LELACVVGAIGGVFLGVGHAIDLAGNYVIAREAQAATARGPVTTPSRLPGGSLVLVPREVTPPNNVFGAHDDVLLAPLGAARVTRIKPNQGGTSLSLRIDFANGARASFKPEQTWPQSDPRREVAAYRMDRLLGIGHVPPAKPIKFTVAELLAAADPQLRTYTTKRITEEAIARGGVLRGMVSWWIPEIRDLWVNGLEGNDPAAFKELISYLRFGVEVPAKYKAVRDQLATCILFDVVINNADRFSGSNTKVSPDLRTLYFMDNTLSFLPAEAGHKMNLRAFHGIQIFPRGLVKRLRELTLDQVKAALTLADDPVGLGPLLTDEEIAAIISRKDNALTHIDGLITQFGEDAVLALP